MEKIKNDTSEREIRLSRLLNAPVDLAWEAISNPEHINHWWGPDGFTTINHKMDLVVGGEWLLTMIGPDGTKFPNRSVFTEIVPNKKIAYKHFNPDFLATIEITPQGNKTQLNWHMLFESKEVYETVVKTYKADKGLEQNGNKLENYLQEIKTNKMETVYKKDITKKQMNVSRSFKAPLELTWKAWTDQDLLDQWWAPLPWKTKTKSMDFKEGGTWLYSMVGPDGSKHWARADYQKIVFQNYFIAKDAFCDESGKITESAPKQNWRVEFHGQGENTQVQVMITFDSEKDLQAIVDMGFEAGFRMAHENLDAFFKAQFKLWGENKPSSKARTSSYLNFPGNTEEVFNFYKSVFKTEFAGKGIQRFTDVPAQPGQPPLSENVKKMVLHVELPITGGHVLMATDAPEEMGFTLTTGNNMHICVEPETRTETKRLYEALSKGGKIEMELQDMFFGAYFASFTDKYGINWMLNCYEKK